MSMGWSAGPQAADRARPPGPGAGRRAGHGGPGHRPPGPAGPGAGDRSRPRRPAGRRRRAPGPRSAAGARAGGGRRPGGRRHRRCGRPSGRWAPLPDATAHRPGAAGRRAQLQGLGPGGRPADADEQPRPRGGRAPPGPRRLRRDRTGRPQLGGVRRHRRQPPRAGGRRDPARAVRQAGGGVPHPRVGAPGADRQRQPRARLGHLGRVPAPRGAGPDHVRPDDRRLVDLHRHPGDPPGHLRVLLRHRRAPVRRHPGRHGHAHRRASGAWAAPSRWP